MPGTKEWMEQIGKGTRFNGETAAEAGRKGAEVSNRKKKDLNLWKEVILERLQETDMKEVVDRLILNAATNGGKDFEILRDTMGQKPVERKEIRAEMTIEDILAGEGNEPEL